MKESRPFGMGGTVEGGYLILTMMPSTFCKFRCPHCYLTIGQREDRRIMRKGVLDEIARDIAQWYTSRGIGADVLAYWYGGEPTQMGRPKFEELADILRDHFAEGSGHRLEGRILSALVGVDIREWKPVVEKYARNRIQTSDDGAMRGRGYLEKWARQVKRWRAAGAQVDTISVLNRSMEEEGPAALMDRYRTLGIGQAGFLPFMKNGANTDPARMQGDRTQYAAWASGMDAFSDWMIAVTGDWLESPQAEPVIGNAVQILVQRMRDQAPGRGYANTGAQTLFLLTDGTLCMPDYAADGTEFLQPFGRMGGRDGQSFAQVLKSPARRKWLRRQVGRNANPECRTCSHADCCLMEFWKENPPQGECYGAKRYVEWVLENADRIGERVDLESCSVG